MPGRQATVWRLRCSAPIRSPVKAAFAHTRAPTPACTDHRLARTVVRSDAHRMACEPLPLVHAPPSGARPHARRTCSRAAFVAVVRHVHVVLSSLRCAPAGGRLRTYTSSGTRAWWTSPVCGSAGSAVSESSPTAALSAARARSRVSQHPSE